jgi:hypothetical protein
MVRSQDDWPDWWDWELDLSLDHLRKQMLRRKFSETDLREMLDRTSNLREDDEPGRRVSETTWESQAWEVVLEPQMRERTLLVITAYRVEPLQQV